MVHDAYGLEASLPALHNGAGGGIGGEGIGGMDMVVYVFKVTIGGKLAFVYKLFYLFYRKDTVFLTG